MNKEKKYCKLCKMFHNLIIKKTFIEECNENGFESEAYYKKSLFWDKKDNVEMLNHNLKRLDILIKKEEIISRKNKLDYSNTEKQNNNCNLIPIYVNPNVVDISSLCKHRFEREVIIQKLKEKNK